MRAEPPAPKDGAAVRIFPPLVPLVTVLAGVGLGHLWPIGLSLGESLPGLVRFGGGLLIIATGLAVWSMFLFQRSGQDPTPWKPTPEVLQRGPYRFTRNPMYLSLVLLCLGFALQRSNIWILFLTPLAAWVIHRWIIPAEEAYLERKFGDTYRAYKERVRRWI